MITALTAEIIHKWLVIWNLKYVNCRRFFFFFAFAMESNSAIQWIKPSVWQYQLKDKHQISWTGSRQIFFKILALPVANIVITLVMSSKHIIMPVCWPLIKFFWERKKRHRQQFNILGTFPAYDYNISYDWKFCTTILSQVFIYHSIKIELNWLWEVFYHFISL